MVLHSADSVMKNKYLFHVLGLQLILMAAGAQRAQVRLYTQYISSMSDLFTGKDVNDALLFTSCKIESMQVLSFIEFLK